MLKRCSCIPSELRSRAGNCSVRTTVGGSAQSNPETCFAVLAVFFSSFDSTYNVSISFLVFSHSLSRLIHCGKSRDYCRTDLQLDSPNVTLGCGRRRP